MRTGRGGGVALTGRPVVAAAGFARPGCAWAVSSCPCRGSGCGWAAEGGVVARAGVVGWPWAAAVRLGSGCRVACRLGRARRRVAVRRRQRRDLTGSQLSGSPRRLAVPERRGGGGGRRPRGGGGAAWGGGGALRPRRAGPPE